MPGRSRGVTIALMSPLPRPWLDPAIAAALAATVVGLALAADGTDENVLIGAVAVPLLWRRSAPLVAAAALAAGIVLSALPTFTQERCGIAIPVGLAILFSLAVRRDRGEAVAGLALVLAGMGVLLFTDPQLGVGGAFILPLCAGVWCGGRLVRSHGRVAAELADRSRQLARTREENARLAVELDRATIAADLEFAARRPLGAMVALADAGVAQSDRRQSRERFASIERQGRESLDELRQMLGSLRDDEPSRSPPPTLADLDALVARAGVKLEASGRRRPLPAGVELAGYRLVQHALHALGTPESVPIAIALRYLPDALELEIRGHIADLGAAEPALAAARERVMAHGGSFSRERVDGACVLRGRLPAAASG